MFLAKRLLDCFTNPGLRVFEELLAMLSQIAEKASIHGLTSKVLADYWAISFVQQTDALRQCDLFEFELFVSECIDNYSALFLDP